MDLGLRGKAIVVTGAGRGIGRAIAQALAAEGAHLALCAREEGPLTEAARACEKLGAHVFARTADVTDAGSVDGFIAEAAGRLGGLDGVVNNAGRVVRFRTFADLTVADWTETLDQNLLGAVRVLKAAQPHLARKAGSIVNIASNWGREPSATVPDYAAAKAALLALTKSLAHDWAAQKIRVNAVCPGPVLTPAWEEDARRAGPSKGQTPQDFLGQMVKASAEAVDLKRIGRPEDVAGLVAFLLSDAASWITGACFVVDGGASRSM